MPSPVHPYSDYGVAMRTLRSARGWLGFMLLACVLAQFVGFALMWWTQQPYVGMKPQMVTTTQMAAAAGTEGFFPDVGQSAGLNVRKQWRMAYTLVPVTQLASLIAVSSQAIIVFLTLLVVLIAQAPGVAQITRSLIWSVLLLFMFLPWQYFARDFPIPGVIYGYTELCARISKQVVGIGVPPYQIWLVYGRFLVWPAMGLLALLITAERYRAGVMIAIGHPLQSMLQPRGNGGMPAIPGPPVPAGMKGRPMVPLKR